MSFDRGVVQSRVETPTPLPPYPSPPRRQKISLGLGLKQRRLQCRWARLKLRTFKNVRKFLYRSLKKLVMEKQNMR